MATKKNPFEEKPYTKPDTRQSIAPIPEQSLALKDIVNKPGTKNLVDQRTGKITGFEYAPGEFILPKGNAPTQKQEMQVEAQKKTAQAQFNVSNPELVSNVGVLTPEQQAMINAPVDVNRTPNAKQVLSTALEQGAYGALAGAGAGGLTASIPGAIIGGASGAILGAVRGGFQAYKYKDVDNAKGAEANFNNAQESINGAISLVNKGGDLYLAEKEFNNAKVGILRTQAVYKSLEKNREWATGIKDKQVELDYYINYVLPRKEEQLRLALMQPNPNFNEVMQ